MQIHSPSHQITQLRNARNIFKFGSEHTTTKKEAKTIRNFAMHLIKIIPSDMRQRGICNNILVFHFKVNVGAHGPRIAT